jgi:hypothetical protein
MSRAGFLWPLFTLALVSITGLPTRPACHHLFRSLVRPHLSLNVRKRGPHRPSPLICCRFASTRTRLVQTHMFDSESADDVNVRKDTAFTQSTTILGPISLPISLLGIDLGQPPRHNVYPQGFCQYQCPPSAEPSDPWNWKQPQEPLRWIFVRDCITPSPPVISSIFVLFYPVVTSLVGN